MSDVKVAQDFMRRKLVTLSSDTNVIDGVARLLKDNISGAPVVDDKGKYLGVFSEKCCMNALTLPVEVAEEVGIPVARVRDFMTCNLTTLEPEVDVFDAIDHILLQRISGAPVVDADGKYLGIFSEKTAMRVLISALYDQLPGTNVGSYMNVDRNRLISDEDSLLDVAHKFQQTPYRRLPVLYGERLAGQVSRRDVLRAEHRLATEVEERSRKPGDRPKDHRCGRAQACWSVHGSRCPDDRSKHRFAWHRADVLELTVSSFADRGKRKVGGPSESSRFVGSNCGIAPTKATTSWCRTSLLEPAVRLGSSITELKQVSVRYPVRYSAARSL